MSETKETQRGRRGRSTGPAIADAYGFEIAVALLTASGVFLLVERLQIKATLYSWSVAALRRVAAEVHSALAQIWHVLEINEKSDIVGGVLIVAACGLVADRMRRRWIGRHPIEDTCSICGVDLFRRRRTWPQRVLGVLLRVELSAYGCRGCGRRGVAARQF
jgi:hypothetical protein